MNDIKCGWDEELRNDISFIVKLVMCALSRQYPQITNITSNTENKLLPIINVFSTYFQHHPSD